MLKSVKRKRYNPLKYESNTHCSCYMGIIVSNQYSHVHYFKVTLFWSDVLKVYSKTKKSIHYTHCYWAISTEEMQNFFFTNLTISYKLCQNVVNPPSFDVSKIPPPPLYTNTVKPNPSSIHIHLHCTICLCNFDINLNFASILEFLPFG